MIIRPLKRVNDEKDQSPAADLLRCAAYPPIDVKMKSIYEKDSQCQQKSMDVVQQKDFQPGSQIDNSH